MSCFSVTFYRPFFGRLTYYIKFQSTQTTVLWLPHCTLFDYPHPTSCFCGAYNRQRAMSCFSITFYRPFFGRFTYYIKFQSTQTTVLWLPHCTLFDYPHPTSCFCGAYNRLRAMSCFSITFYRPFFGRLTYYIYQTACSYKHAHFTTSTLAS